MLRWCSSAAKLFSLRLAVCGWACLWLCGCEPESLSFREVKRIHERITPAEWASFVRIVDRLPDRRIPEFGQPVFPMQPQWRTDRSLPVHELYAEELRRREESWDSALLARAFERNKSLLRELRKEKLTTEQFAGLLLTLGAAACRHDLPEDVDLAALVDRARPVLEELAHSPLAFQKLPPESQHAVMQQALWISRKLRAEKLRQVPPENIALVHQHQAWIEDALPEEFRTNPMHEIRDQLEEQGLPFEELPESGFDEDLRWPLGALPVTRH